MAIQAAEISAIRVETFEKAGVPSVPGIRCLSAQTVKGFAAKTEAKLLEAIEELKARLSKLAKIQEGEAS